MKPHPLEIAARLAAAGIEVRSAELLDGAKRLNEFHDRGGNRALRRAAAKAARRKR